MTAMSPAQNKLNKGSNNYHQFGFLLVLGLEFRIELGLEADGGHHINVPLHKKMKFSIKDFLAGVKLSLSRFS